jgi:hypothetical protein
MTWSGKLKSRSEVVMMKEKQQQQNKACLSKDPQGRSSSAGKILLCRCRRKLRIKNNDIGEEALLLALRLPIDARSMRIAVVCDWLMI